MVASGADRYECISLSLISVSPKGRTFHETTGESLSSRTRSLRDAPYPLTKKFSLCFHLPGREEKGHGYPLGEQDYPLFPAPLEWTPWIFFSQGYFVPRHGQSQGSTRL